MMVMVAALRLHFGDSGTSLLLLVEIWKRLVLFAVYLGAVSRGRSLESMQKTYPYQLQVGIRM